MTDADSGASIHTSKVDTWLILVAALAAGASVGVAVALLREGGVPAVVLVPVVVLLGADPQPALQSRAVAGSHPHRLRPGLERDDFAARPDAISGRHGTIPLGSQLVRGVVTRFAGFRRAIMAEPTKRMRAMRARRGGKGLRALRLVVPDARSPTVRRQVAREVAALNRADEDAALGWIERVAEFDGR